MSLATNSRSPPFEKAPLGTPESSYTNGESMFKNLSCWLIALLFATASHIPRIQSRLAHTSSTPLWVSADAAFDSAGNLRPDLFTKSARFTLDNELRQNSAGECKAFLSGPPLEDFSRRDSLDALISNALTIFEGEVTNTATGFYDGTPGTLFAVSRSNVFKSFGHVASDGDVFLFIAEATIETSHGPICARTFSTTPTPQVGDHVIVFSSLPPIDAGSRILAVDTDTQLVVSHKGSVYAPLSIQTLASGKRIRYANLNDLSWAIRENPHVQDVPGERRQ